MKRLVITLVAVFYLGVSSGATMHLHYCMGQLVEWGLISKNPNKCSKCGMKTGSTKDCCKDEHKQFKIESAQKISENSFQLKAPGLDLALFLSKSETDLHITSLIQEYPIGNAPPDTQNTPRFIRNCSFRI
jgi:hypothetical protein